MNNPLRWKQRLQNFEKAFVVFERRIDEYEQNTEEEAYQMALVQGFAVIQELSWRVLKDYLENEGYDSVGNSKQVIKQAFRAEIITNGEVWMESIENRNRTSHMYDVAALTEILEFIHHSFCPVVADLYHKLKKEL